MESCNFEVPISYYDKRFSIDAVKLLPGQYFVTTQDKMLVTVLARVWRHVYTTLKRALAA